jgi:hypothetical protein
MHPLAQSDHFILSIFIKIQIVMEMKFEWHKPDQPIVLYFENKTSFHCCLQLILSADCPGDIHIGNERLILHSTRNTSSIFRQFS